MGKMRLRIMESVKNPKSNRKRMILKIGWHLLMASVTYYEAFPVVQW